MNFPDEEATELVEAQWLRKYAGMVGYIQLGFVYQGIVFLHETTTEWYERFQSLLEDIESFKTSSSTTTITNTTKRTSKLGERDGRSFEQRHTSAILLVSAGSLPNLIRKKPRRSPSCAHSRRTGRIADRSRHHHRRRSFRLPQS